MAVRQEIQKEITNLFLYFSDGIIPPSQKSLVEESLSIIKKMGGPEITLQYDAEADGYLPMYNNVTYQAGDAQSLIDDFGGSPFNSTSVFYGTIGPADEADGLYSVEHFIDRMVTQLTQGNRIITAVGATLSFPGNNVTLTAVGSIDGSCSELYLTYGDHVISVIPTEDEWLEKNPQSSLSGYKYVNYQVIKSVDGDILMKAFLSDSPTGESNNASTFASKSINHYSTANINYSYDPPKVHHALDSLDGGFALLQYDSASADEIEWNTSYGWGCLLMNTQAAPLVYVTSDSGSMLNRTATTSLHNLDGENYSLVNEVSFTPCPLDTTDATAMLMPIMTPSSGKDRSMRSRWACMAPSEVYSEDAGSRKIGAGMNMFYIDHGLCLGGGADVYAD